MIAMSYSRRTRTPPAKRLFPCLSTDASSVTDCMRICWNSEQIESLVSPETLKIAGAGTKQVQQSRPERHLPSCCYGHRLGPQSRGYRHPPLAVRRATPETSADTNHVALLGVRNRPEDPAAPPSVVEPDASPRGRREILNARRRRPVLRAVAPPSPARRSHHRNPRNRHEHYILHRSRGGT